MTSPCVLQSGFAGGPLPGTAFGRTSMPPSASSLLCPVLRAVAFVLALSCACTAAHARDLRVMSFNVRLPVAADGENRW